jgi:hypothetical protein
MHRQFDNPDAFTRCPPFSTVRPQLANQIFFDQRISVRALPILLDHWNSCAEWADQKKLVSIASSTEGQSGRLALHSEGKGHVGEETFSSATIRHPSMAAVRGLPQGNPNPGGFGPCRAVTPIAHLYEQTLVAHSGKIAAMNADFGQILGSDFALFEG